MNLDNLTPSAVESAVRTAARKIAASPESEECSKAEIANTAKALVRTAFIQEHSWRALEENLDEAEAEAVAAAIRHACEAWNAIVDEAMAEKAAAGDGPANNLRTVRRCLASVNASVERTGPDHMLVECRTNAYAVRDLLDGAGYRTRVHNDEDVSIYFGA